MWLSLIYVVMRVDWLEKLKGRNFNVLELIYLFKKYLLP